MKTRLKLCDCLFGFVCLSITLSDAVSAVTNNTNVSTSASPSASIKSTSILVATSSLSFAPVQPPNPQDDKNNPELSKRRAFVVEMMKHAWDAYVKCSWGKSNFQPLECKGGGGDCGNIARDIWEAMPTLWIMGLRDEFNRARKWVEQANIDVDMMLNLGESINFHTFVGSMLSCYALTGGDTFFLDRALNYTMIYMAGEKSRNQFKDVDWPNMQLEMYYLTHLTGNQSYRQYAQVIERKMEKQHTSLSAKIEYIGGDYLLIKAKQYVQSNYNDNLTRMMQVYRAIDEMQKKVILNRTMSGLWYIENRYQPIQLWSNERIFRADLCNIGAVLSLGAMLMPLTQYNVTSWRLLSVDQLKAVSAYWELANNYTDMCYWANKLTSDYMIPLHIYRMDIPDDSHPYYTAKIDALTIQETIRKFNNERFYPVFNLDSYQLLESYFTLSRLTGERKYADNAWQMANKLNQYTRVPNGYVSGVADNVKIVDQDIQPPLFYSTLSYIYLMFTPDTYLPLDKWVFNYAGHPLPICGSGNPAYPNVKC